MTRPQIIRADTLDLQDRTSPTAQDHSRQPQHPAPLGIGPAAPHQEASLRQLDNERHSQEAHLQDGTWSDPSSLRDDPDSDDERAAAGGGSRKNESQRDEQAVRLNGGIAGDIDDAEMQEADAEEDLDDDADRISSSPSIDDGGYSSSSPSTTWPERTSSLPSSPIQSPASSQSQSTCVDSSSPFTATPIHFPLSVAAARRPSGVPACREKHIFTSISSYRPSPIPFLTQPSSTTPSTVRCHHRGEYTWISDADDADTIANDFTTGSSCPHEVSPRTGHMLRVEDRLSQLRDDSQISLISGLDEDEIQAMLQPVRSPTLETFDDPFQDELEPQSPPNEDAEDDDAWTTDSDADSWDAEAGNDDDDDFLFSKDSRFVDSGWGGECLRETEDIDFEFVYALHTFVATVEGQANAQKGDTMVLLDDSNSYWWLVRVVKDSSIGYLPAEHIETPTERLARLNKHRNIDLSATMLGDTAEKTKNPLKKAIRRRNAKTVQFGEPTYVEASDYDYSSDEDGDDELFGGADPTQAQTQAAAERADVEQDDDLKVEPLKLGAKGSTASAHVESAQEPSDESSKANAEKRSSDEIFDRPLDQKVSRNGTLRNTDSFFKDENAETRKISLTPNLLRDDSSTSTTGSRERGASLESLEKNGFADKVKDDKKKKEKKSGMLSGLFKRKDKKSKGALDSFDSDVEKLSEELGRSSPQAKESMEERPPTEQASSSPQRQASKGKLQKPQRGREDSPSKVVTKGILKKEDADTSATQNGASSLESSGKKSAAPSATMRLVAPEQEDVMEASSEQPQQRMQSPQSPEGRARSNSAASKLNPINMLKAQQPDDESRPEKVKKAKQRVQLDDFDSEEDENKDPFADTNSADAHPSQTTASEPTNRLCESPIEISVADAQTQESEVAQGKEHELDAQRPPGLTTDTSSQETPSPVSTPSPDHSPSTTGPPKLTLSSSHPSSAPSSSSAIPPPSRPAPIPTKEPDVSPPVSSETSTLPAWSDSSLRMYLDDGSDIRDTLALINDTTGVVPVGRDHPLMSSLFVEESKAVTQLGGELDALLSNWLENKRRKHKASAAGTIRAR